MTEGAEGMSHSEEGSLPHIDSAERFPRARGRFGGEFEDKCSHRAYVASLGVSKRWEVNMSLELDGAWSPRRSFCGCR